MTRIGRKYHLMNFFNDIGISVKYFIDSDLSGYLEWDPDLNNGIGDQLYI